MQGSVVFFKTTFYTENRLPGGRVNRLVKHLIIRGVLEKPKDSFICTPDRTHRRMRSPRSAVSPLLVESHPKQQ